MFSYIKNLNDMVFSPTADSPEEQPNGSGVLSRIGSWIWARSPIGSSDNPSPTSGRAGQPDSLADDVFYPFPQDSKKSSQTTESKPSGEETPEEEWEEARSSFDCSNQDTKNSFCSTEDSGKKLHVYLEEISESAGHEIVSTKYAKSLKVRPKAKSSVSLDTENRHRYSSELVGVNLKPQAFEHLEDLEMGRKGARRRHRKDSQGDDKSNSTKPCQELTDKDVSSSQRAKSPKSKHASNTAPSPSPEVKSRSSGCVESSQGLQSTLACSGAALKEANMEDNDRLYRVERKTETPESKRRSMKVSRSEVKLFPKNVPLPSARPEKSDFKMTVGREGIKEETSADLKLKEAKNTEEKAKPAMGRITDRINIFEKRKLETGRQLDAPLNAEQRSRSAECLDQKRSSSSSPPRNRVMTIQERVRNFNQACNTSSQTQNLSRTHRKVSASKSLELLDVPDGPDASEKDMLKAALQFNGGNAKTSVGKLKVEAHKVVEKNETKVCENTDAIDSCTMPSKSGSKTKRRKSKELTSQKNETNTIEPLKQEMARDEIIQRQIDQVENVVMQVSESTSQKSLHKNVQDTTSTKKQNADKNMPNVEDIFSKTGIKISENALVENSIVDTSTSKKGEKDVQKSPAIFSETDTDTYEKQLRNEREVEIDSAKSKDKVASVGGKEVYKLPTPELKTTHNSSTEKSQPYEKVALSKEKKLVETPTEHGLLDENKSKLNTSRQLKEKSKADSTTKGNNSTDLLNAFDKVNNTSAVTQQADTIAQLDSVNKKSNVKRAASHVIDKKQTKTANEVKGNTLQKLTKASEHNLSTDKAGNVALSGELKDASIFNKVDLTKVILKTAPTSGEEDIRVKNDGSTKITEIEHANEVQHSLNNIEYNVDLPKNRPNNNDTKEQEKPGHKHEDATKGKDTIISEPSNKKKNSITKIENEVKIESVKQQIDATVKQEQTCSQGQSEKSICSEINNGDTLQLLVASATKLQQVIAKTDIVKTGEQTKKDSLLTVSDSNLPFQKDPAQQDGGEGKIVQLSVCIETDTRGHTKQAIDQDPAFLPQKELEMADQNTALFTAGTEDSLTGEKSRLAYLDVPVPERNDGEESVENVDSKKQGAVRKNGKCINKTSTLESSKQAERLDIGVARKEQKNILSQAPMCKDDTASTSKPIHIDDKVADQKVDQQEKATLITSLSAVEPVEIENNALSVKFNEGEGDRGRQTIGLSALTSSVKMCGKGTLPIPASETKPQAKSETVENKIPNWPDDSEQKGELITGENGGVLNVAVFEPMDIVEKARSVGSNLNVGKILSDRPKDLSEQASKSTGSETSIGNTTMSNEIAANSKAVSQAPVCKDDPASKSKPTPKTTPEDKQFLNLSLKRHNFTKGRSKDDWSQDVPSSYLDVDFPKQKFKVLSEGKLTSSGSESNLLDTSGDLDDEDFVEKIKKLCAPFSLPPRRHHPLRSPQPPFAMPAIKEDRFEKTFDPEMFTFGLRKKSKFSLETPSLLAKLQNPDGKPCIKAARASLAERSMLLSGLESRFRDKDASKDEQEEAKDDAKDEIKVKSRLEGSCVLNSLTTSSFRSKPGQSQAQTQSTISENVSPGPPPCPAQTNPEERDKKEEIQCAEELVACDSAPPIPTSNQVKLSDFLLKHHPEEAELEQEQPSGEQEVAVKMPSLDQPSATTAQTPPKSLTNHFSGISLKDQAPPPAAPPRRRPANKIQAAKGFHKRPGKMLLFEKAPFEGQVYEVHRDVEDATSMLLSALVSVRVVRGCWVLYENPGFQGRTIALEEGALELTNIWAQPAPDLGLEPGLEPLEPCDTPLQIGSIRLAVSDYSIPHIDLFTEPEGRGRVTSYHDDVMETGSFGIPLSTASVQVHSGVWLVFSDPGFQGMLAVLEMGGYPLPEAWGFPSPFVGSLRPLKMGGLKVENPNEVKALVYECSGFEGPALETEADMFCFGEEGGGQDTSLQSVGSLKILGGLWVGFSEPGFEGQQYILEEGEYESCEAWGGGHILSLRPIMADFMSPHVKLFSDRDFGALGVNIDLTIPVINLDDTGYGLKTQSINVVSGVWVVFEEAGFSGESFLLERGQYGTPEDWGSARPVIASAMPVVLENFENTAKFKIQLFPEADFQGPVVELDDSEAHLPPGCSVASCKVLAGSWLAYEGPDYSGSMYVLEEGSYSDLRAMGCVHSSATILSLQIAGFEFSLPSIVLFERAELKGKRLVLCEGEVNLLMSGGGGRVQSVLVEGGMWVLYEEINYRGAQILLRPGEVCDWRHFSGWRRMGSLRPLLQKQVHFHICSRLSGQLLTVTGDLDDIKLLRVQETEASGGFEQIWFFQHGHLRCKLLEECCLCPSSSVTIAGARVGLTPALDNTTHMWSITPEGFISYSANPDLVLDIKGGHNYDKSQVVLNTRDPKRAQQQWLIQVL
ncbi:unnamed protein product [Knipowitschia caucasica]